MRTLPLAALLLAGCGTAAPRKPCEYDVHVRLTEDANAECHTHPMRGHDGVRVNNTTDVSGCGNGQGIISNGTRSNVGHEQGHAIEDFCPEWAKGYFD